jgi:hypothetical protein
MKLKMYLMAPNRLDYHDVFTVNCEAIFTSVITVNIDENFYIPYQCTFYWDKLLPAFDNTNTLQYTPALGLFLWTSNDSPYYITINDTITKNDKLFGTAFRGTPYVNPSTITPIPEPVIPPIGWRHTRFIEFNGGNSHHLIQTQLMDTLIAKKGYFDIAGRMVAIHEGVGFNITLIPSENPTSITLRRVLQGGIQQSNLFFLQSEDDPKLFINRRDMSGSPHVPDDEMITLRIA